MRILVTGANGQLGLALAAQVRPGEGLEWHFHGRNELDVTDEQGVLQFVQFLQPEVIIHTAAYTAVDNAEADVDGAFAMNRDAVTYVAAAAVAVGATLIHISSDYVYDNGQQTPYVETDAVHPVGVYARSKRAGEQEALILNPDTMIIRTSWLYGPDRHNFLLTMLHLGANKEEIKVVFDQVGTPTYTGDLASALIEILLKVKDDPDGRARLRGIFNFSNEGVTSWYDFAVAIMRLRGFPCRVLPVRTKAYPTPARRPPYSVMDKTKIKDSFGLRIPHWMESLEKCLQVMQASVDKQ